MAFAQSIWYWIKSLTRVYSSRMRTTRLLTIPYPIVSHVSWGSLPKAPRCRPPLDAAPPLDADSQMQIPLIMWPVMHARKPTSPPMDRQTPVKRLPCPRLRLQAVKMHLNDRNVQPWRSHDLKWELMRLEHSNNMKRYTQTRCTMLRSPTHSSPPFPTAIMPFALHGHVSSNFMYFKGDLQDFA